MSYKKIIDKKIVILNNSFDSLSITEVDLKQKNGPGSLHFLIL